MNRVWVKHGRTYWGFSIALYMALYICNMKPCYCPERTSQRSMKNPNVVWLSAHLVKHCKNCQACRTGSAAQT